MALLDRDFSPPWDSDSYPIPYEGMIQQRLSASASFLIFGGLGFPFFLERGLSRHAFRLHFVRALSFTGMAYH